MVGDGGGLYYPIYWGLPQSTTKNLAKNIKKPAI
jgi:hypothetical protein